MSHTSCFRLVRNAGLSLVEVLVASAVITALGVALLQVTSRGAQVSARGTEVGLASLVGARVVDRLISEGFDGLARYIGTEGVMNLGSMGEPTETGEGDPALLVVDGLGYGARYKVTQLEPGLLRLDVTLSWKKAGGAAGPLDGTLALTRLVANPTVALNEK